MPVTSCSRNGWLRNLGVSYSLRIAESKEVSVCSEKKNLQFSAFPPFIPDFGYSRFLFFSWSVSPDLKQTFGSVLYIFLFCFFLLFITSLFYLLLGFILIVLLFEMLLWWLPGFLIFWTIFLGCNFLSKHCLSNIPLVLICSIFIVIQLKILSSLNHDFKVYL